MLMFYTTALLKPQFLIGSWSLATLNIKKKTLLRFKPTLFIGRRIFFWSHRDDDSDLRIKIITIFLCESKCGSNTHIWVRRSLWYVAYSLKEAELNTIFTVSINENAKINTESCPERRAVIFARCVTANALKAWEHFRWEMDVDSLSSSVTANTSHLSTPLPTLTPKRSKRGVAAWTNIKYSLWTPSFSSMFSPNSLGFRTLRHHSIRHSIRRSKIQTSLTSVISDTIFVRAGLRFNPSVLDWLMKSRHLDVSVDL